MHFDAELMTGAPPGGWDEPAQKRLSFVYLALYIFEVLSSMFVRYLYFSRWLVYLFVFTIRVNILEKDARFVWRTGCEMMSLFYEMIVWKKKNTLRTLNELYYIIFILNMWVQVEAALMHCGICVLVSVVWKHNAHQLSVSWALSSTHVCRFTVPSFCMEASAAVNKWLTNQQTSLSLHHLPHHQNLFTNTKWFQEQQLHRLALNVWQQRLRHNVQF